MDKIVGVNVANTLVPNYDTDNFPVTDPKYGIDGFRSVADLTERDAIPQERRRWGMLVFVQNDKVYQLGSDLSNESWSEFTVNSANNSPNIRVVAITDAEWDNWNNSQENAGIITGSLLYNASGNGNINAGLWVWDTDAYLRFYGYLPTDGSGFMDGPLNLKRVDLTDGDDLYIAVPKTYVDTKLSNIKINWSQITAGQWGDNDNTPRVLENSGSPVPGLSDFIIWLVGSNYLSIQGGYIQAPILWNVTPKSSDELVNKDYVDTNFGSISNQVNNRLDLDTWNSFIQTYNNFINSDLINTILYCIQNADINWWQLKTSTSFNGSPYNSSPIDAEGLQQFILDLISNNIPNIPYRKLILDGGSASDAEGLIDAIDSRIIAKQSTSNQVEGANQYTGYVQAKVEIPNYTNKAIWSNYLNLKYSQVYLPIPFGDNGTQTTYAGFVNPVTGAKSKFIFAMGKLFSGSGIYFADCSEFAAANVYNSGRGVLPFGCQAIIVICKEDGTFVDFGYLFINGSPGISPINGTGKLAILTVEVLGKFDLFNMDATINANFNSGNWADLGPNYLYGGPNPKWVFKATWENLENHANAPVIPASLYTLP